jgi:hypothetical protein
VQTVDDVLDALDALVDRARRRGERTGFFAVMYRTVTARVKEGIAAGFFDDGERMARLDVAFASRYLDALRSSESGERPTASWDAALAAGRDARPILLQHLLLGVNAHINLDLGIAAAGAAPGGELPALRRDFDRINEILASVLDHVQRAMSRLSPCLGLLDRLGGRHDDEIIRFSLEKARAGAWRFATELAPLDPTAWAGPVRTRDARVARVARIVLRPGLPLEAGLVVVRACERSSVARTLDVLGDVDGPALAAVEARVRDERAGPGHW